MRLLPLILSLSLAFAAPVLGQSNGGVPPNKADIVRLLGRMHEFVPIRKEFSELGFRGENLELAVAQYQRVFSDKQIAGFVADRIIAAYEGALPSATEAGGLLGPLIDRGIGHLSIGELIYFYKVENAVFKALPTRECGLAVKQQLSDRRLTNATARAAARLNTPALKEYYRIQYKAARLGLNNKAVRLSPSATKRIEAKIGEQVFAQTEDARSRSLIRVFGSPDTASNQQACEAGRMIMDTVMTMQGRDLRDALLYFSAP